MTTLPRCIKKNTKPGAKTAIAMNIRIGMVVTSILPFWPVLTNLFDQIRCKFLVAAWAPREASHEQFVVPLVGTFVADVVASEYPLRTC
jgi:hypothetical protein